MCVELAVDLWTCRWFGHVVDEWSWEREGTAGPRISSENHGFIQVAMRSLTYQVGTVHRYIGVPTAGRPGLPNEAGHSSLSNVSKRHPMWQLFQDLGLIVPARWMDLPSDLN